MVDGYSDWTVRALQARGMGVMGLCDAPACKGIFTYNLDRLGEGFGLDALLPINVAAGCQRCGGNLRVVFSLPDAPGKEDR